MPRSLIDIYRERVERFVRNQRRNPSAIRVLVEGDSWFTYGAGLGKGLSVIEKLAQYKTINLVTVANPGAELEHLVDDGNRDWALANNPDWLEGQTYDLVLFSGGGNDVVGSEIRGLLREWREGLSKDQLINKTELARRLAAMQGQYSQLRHTIDRFVGVNVPILTHGYDYAHASGIGFTMLGGIISTGPWILPHLKEKKIDKISDHVAIIKYLVDRFNDLLADLATGPGAINDFHYLDLRNSLTKNHWADELHPTAAGRDLLASAFLQKIRSM